MSLFGIVLGLALLIFLAFKGQSILWVAPVCAAVVALLSMFEDPTINVLTMWTDNYMAAMATFLQTWFRLSCSALFSVRLWRFPAQLNP